MKLAQINLTRGMFIPGLGNTSKLENVECEGTSVQVGTSPDGARMPVHGLVVVTSAAKVVIPWGLVESVVTEWISLKHPLEGKSVGGSGYQPGMPEAACCDAGRKAFVVSRGADWACPEHAPSQSSREVKERAVVAQATGQVQRAVSYVQPPPPQKKGGRR